MNVLETLRCVRELLDSPKAWTQATYARDEKGDPIHALSEEATSFCLLGAAKKCTGNTAEGEGEIYAFAKLLFPVFGDPAGQAWRFNDRSTHAQVLKLLDDGIVRAEVGV